MGNRCDFCSYPISPPIAGLPLYQSGSSTMAGDTKNMIILSENDFGRPKVYHPKEGSGLCAGWLVWFAGKSTIIVYEIGLGRNEIGREARQVPIPPEYRRVGRHHAAIIAEAEHDMQGILYRLEDLGSVHGTFLNGSSKPLEKDRAVEVRSGEYFRVADDFIILVSIFDAVSGVEALRKAHTDFSKILK